MDPDSQIRNFLKRYIKIEDNTFYCDRLFIANSVMKWALENIKDREKIIYYMREVEKHLSGEITLYWKDGTIKVKRDKK